MRTSCLRSSCLEHALNASTRSRHSRDGLRTLNPCPWQPAGQVVRSSLCLSLPLSGPEKRCQACLHSAPIRGRVRPCGVLGVVATYAQKWARRAPLLSSWPRGESLSPRRFSKYTSSVGRSSFKVLLRGSACSQRTRRSPVLSTNSGISLRHRQRDTRQTALLCSGRTTRTEPTNGAETNGFRQPGLAEVHQTQCRTARHTPAKSR